MRRPVCLIGLAFVVVILIYLRWKPLPLTFLDEMDGETVILTGQVDKKEYRISYEKEILVIYLKNIQILNSETIHQQTTISQNSILQVQGVLCYMEEGQEPKMGSHVCMQGKLRAFAQATNPGEFDARNYYQILHLQARLQNASVMEESEYYNQFKERLYQMKKYLAGLIDICYEKKDASIMKAVLLGEKSQLDEETKQLYQLNGIIHILSISGLHISIIGMGLHKLLYKMRCPKFMNILFSIGFMYCYGAMTGMSVSAIRAIIMFGFHIAAGLFGRTYDMLTAMTVAAISILIEQPLYLYHSGFLFSFGAILAIGLFAPVLEENLFGETKIEKLMSTSLSISIFTFPIYLYFYYEYPIYSLFLNLLIIPGTSLLVSDGLFSLIAALSYLPFGKFTVLPAHMLLSFYELCCLFTLKLPGSRCILGQPEIWQIFLFLIIIWIAVFLSRKWSKLQFWQWILLALLCITMRFQDGLQITMLDVGQGDGIYIADEKGGHYLIDGGSSTKSEVGAYQILPFLKEEGVSKLNAVFVTHFDSDHYNGIRTLIEKVNQDGIMIEHLILPDIGENSRSEEYKQLEALARGQGILVSYIHEGDSMQHGKLKFACLHPQAHEEGETNELSVVLYMEYEDFSALFTGDLEQEGEKNVRKRLETYLSGDGITVLKVAHHGSRNSTETAFLETVSPKIALISAGRDNRYGHPHEELMLRLKQTGCHIFQTPKGGAVTLRYQNGRIRMNYFLEEMAGK